MEKASPSQHCANIAHRRMGLPQHHASGQGTGHRPIRQELRSGAGIGLEEEVRIQSAHTQGKSCVSQIKSLQ
jgi:hypothetical protein